MVAIFLSLLIYIVNYYFIYCLCVCILTVSTCEERNVSLLSTEELDCFFLHHFMYASLTCYGI